MTVRKSTKQLPEKPYPSYPLRPHANGQLCKKIRGRVYFFGVWSDPESALAEYNRRRPFLETGTAEPVAAEAADGLTVKNLIDRFLTRLESKADDGKRTRRHFEDCKRTAKIVVSVIDKNRLASSLNGSDFHSLRRRFEKKQDGKKASGATVMGHIRRTKLIFSFGLQEGLIDRVVYGSDFRGLDEQERTKLEQNAADKLLTREQILSLLGSSNYKLRAMILLGANAAMGNTDIARLEFCDLELVGGWYEAQRSKTAVRRCAKLWPETVEALQQVIRRRKEPANKQHREVVFLTRFGKPYDDRSTIAQEFDHARKYAGLDLPRGCGFYSLRHTFRTEAGQLSDDSASRWVMGHKRSRIDDHYSHRPPKERIAKVCDHVRNWLFGKGATDE
jgi:integrase